jgi:hypothetical protein
MQRYICLFLNEVDRIVNTTNLQAPTLTDAKLHAARIGAKNGEVRGVQLWRNNRLVCAIALDSDFLAEMKHLESDQARSPPPER